MEELSRSDRELIREYREYDEDKDPGQHKLNSLISRLSRRAGSQDCAKIEGWVSDQERKYGLIPFSTPSETRVNNLNPVERSEDRSYLEQAIAETTDPQKIAFFSQLLKYKI